MLESGIFASRDGSVFIKVLDIENLADGLEAGGSVSLELKNWSNTGVGGS